MTETKKEKNKGWMKMRLRVSERKRERMKVWKRELERAGE